MKTILTLLLYTELFDRPIQFVINTVECSYKNIWCNFLQSAIFCFIQNPVICPAGFSG